MTLKQMLYVYAQFLWGISLCFGGYFLARHASDIIGSYQLAGVLVGTGGCLSFILGAIGVVGTWTKIADLKALGL